MLQSRMVTKLHGQDEPNEGEAEDTPARTM